MYLLKGIQLRCILMVLLFTFLSSIAYSTEKDKDVPENKILTGKINGEPWAAKQWKEEARLSQTPDAPKTKFLIVATEKELYPYQEMTLHHLIITAPAVDGEFDFMDGYSVTFFSPPSENKISMDGKISIETIDGVKKMILKAKYNDDNFVVGRFILEETTRF